MKKNTRFSIAISLLVGFLLLSALLVGCHSIPKKTPIPSVDPVLDSLVVLSDQIDAAGDSNSKAAGHVKTAIELAEELSDLLNKIEKEKTK